MQRELRVLAIARALRPERRLDEVLRDQDFQPILAHNPRLHETWSFTSVGGPMMREVFSAAIKLRVVASGPEPCVNTYNGPTLRRDGAVLGCSCLAVMDAVNELGWVIYLQGSLPNLWSGSRMRALGSSFAAGTLNPTSASGDLCCDLEFYEPARAAGGMR